MASARTRELAAKAADEIERRGLWRNMFYNPKKVDRQQHPAATPEVWDDCEMCAWGALNYADHGNPINTPPDVERALFEIHDYVPFGMDLDAYNDLPETTKEDIVALLREVAAA